ncbi:MAG TPA: hypothetical protein VLK25_00775 [Allosphingosinicella sp.]|nr:hypothetical protein [Allosphingosinicella sp.]
MNQRPGADAELGRVLGVNFVNFAGSLTMESAVSRSWASITFAGARHTLSLLLEGPAAGEAARAFLDGIGEREFELRGHLVADIVADISEDGEDRARLTLEALTVELDQD